METYWNILIFIIILFLYMHIIDQYKKSEDLEIYEMDYVSNNDLQTICNIKQPVLFELNSEITLETIEEKSQYDVKVRDTNDNSDYILLKFDSFKTLIDTDSESHFITENNHEFVEESGLYNSFSILNDSLKPVFSVNTQYDILMGSKNAHTPLRYHTNDRLFYLVVSGKIRVKMTPWKSAKYLNPMMDYDNYEFRSDLDPFDSDETGKIKFLEFDVLANYVLYIPPYWWYSIQYDESDTLVLGAKYISMMNLIANSHHLFKYYIQQYSTKTKVVRTLISEKENLSTII
jgi:hypothetical protein